MAKEGREREPLTERGYEGSNKGTENKQEEETEDWNSGKTARKSQKKGGSVTNEEEQETPRKTTPNETDHQGKTQLTGRT